MISNILHIDRNKIYEARLGIQADDYKEMQPKVKNKLIFCSAPERGFQLIYEQKTSMIHLYPCDAPYEMFCLASLECQAAGTPTVATSLGALSTTVQHNRTGKLIHSLPDYDSNFYETFANTAIELLTNPLLLHQLSVNARERAFSEFTYEGLVAELEGKFAEWSS